MAAFSAFFTLSFLPILSVGIKITMRACLGTGATRALAPHRHACTRRAQCCTTPPPRTQRGTGHSRFSPSTCTCNARSHVQAPVECVWCGTWSCIQIPFAVCCRYGSKALNRSSSSLSFLVVAKPEIVCPGGLFGRAPETRWCIQLDQLLPETSSPPASTLKTKKARGNCAPVIAEAEPSGGLWRRALCSHTQNCKPMPLCLALGAHLSLYLGARLLAPARSPRALTLPPTQGLLPAHTGDRGGKGAAAHLRHESGGVINGPVA